MCTTQRPDQKTPIPYHRRARSDLQLSSSLPSVSASGIVFGIEGNAKGIYTRERLNACHGYGRVGGERESPARLLLGDSSLPNRSLSDG